ncbi:surface antigen BspA-like [Trichomonas vaginalis G3]|uniref:Surface antigen BspA-like n=1 Tax=Trichomonas vaginalis (strain ATCC PRA-98 / G3) TaxID=412133 RepID=A2F784_TRIV3|nr:ribonuclease inhibitor domain-containing protein [Trichomonas vaginalis G3]EAX99251.1 surface antigen BspA-like [Trichomonas vaginalis G3]KAI5547930.1 ribonuclease inhibitor domain-containing protein [Trichomonas vaginalis G3]|eukprot:XP_001312181.1 surface antigen BspA-like [Trichomonas vaginalis G3]
MENNFCIFQYLEKAIVSPSVSQFSAAYFNNPNMKEFVVTGNQNFISIDKVIYTSNNETLYAYPAGLEANEFTVPDFVKTINPYSFSYCDKLEKIIVSSNILLSNGMFIYCTSVKSIELKAPLNFFPEGCFAFCSNLTSIVIPETSVVTQLFSHCFHGCFSLQNLNFNNKIELVDFSCFEKCISLIDIDLSQLTEISESCFRFCSQERINLHLSDKLRSISKNAFENSKIVEFICPRNLMYIGDYAFSYCIELKIFKFNDKIAQIGNKTFNYAGFDEIFIPDSLRIIQPTSFCNQHYIQFTFSEGGHPKFYVENDCFMNKAGELVFIIRGDKVVFELPPNVKIFGTGSINESNYNRIVVKSDISDSHLLYSEEDKSKLCVKSFSNNSCNFNISDVNNIERYAKEGEYEPTYKLSNNLYIKDSFIHISEYITDSSYYEYLPQKSFIFNENSRLNSILEVILSVFVSFLLIIIMILAIIALKESRKSAH